MGTACRVLREEGDIKVTARRHGNEQRTKRLKREAWEVKLLDLLYVARG